MVFPGDQFSKVFCLIQHINTGGFGQQGFSLGAVRVIAQLHLQPIARECVQLLEVEAEEPRGG